MTQGEHAWGAGRQRGGPPFGGGIRGSSRCLALPGSRSLPPPPPMPAPRLALGMFQISNFVKLPRDSAAPSSNIMLLHVGLQVQARLIPVQNCICLDQEGQKCTGWAGVVKGSVGPGPSLEGCNGTPSALNTGGSPGDAVATHG